jgi:hypothetical protein
VSAAVVEEFTFPLHDVIDRANAGTTAGRG